MPQPSPALKPSDLKISTNSAKSALPPLPKGCYICPSYTKLPTTRINSQPIPLYPSRSQCGTERCKCQKRASYSRLPILPKQTQLTNSTLAIHVATPTDSLLHRPATSSEPWCSCVFESVLLMMAACEAVGEGTRSGLMPSRSAVPESATVVLRMNPGALLSRRYHSVGFDRARVRESWRVECQGILRCEPLC